MSSFLAGLLLGLAVVGLWLFVRPRRSEKVVVDNDLIDQEILKIAEEEVAELDAMATPEDAAEDLPDWGPGAPRA